MNQQRDLHHVIRDLDKGKVSSEGGAALRRVITAAQRTGLKGSLTLTIGVESVDPDHVQLTAKIVAKAPTAETESTLFLVVEEGDVEPVQQVLSFEAGAGAGN